MLPPVTSTVPGFDVVAVEPAVDSVVPLMPPVLAVVPPVLEGLMLLLPPVGADVPVAASESLIVVSDVHPLAQARANTSLKHVGWNVRIVGTFRADLV